MQEGALHEDYKLSAYDADVLVAEKESADYFEDMAKSGAEPKTRGQLGASTSYLAALTRRRRLPLRIGLFSMGARPKDHLQPDEHNRFR